jgi:hypothetical protein
LEPAGTDNTVSWLAIRTHGATDAELTSEIQLTKPKTRADLAHSFDADWPPRGPITLTDLIAEARAVDWDFTTWCFTSGDDVGDPDARHMFERLLAYARREGRAGLN